jgi:hypothetical protein
VVPDLLVLARPVLGASGCAVGFHDLVETGAVGHWRRLWRLGAAQASGALVGWLDGEQQPLDLTKRTGRLLAETAALVLAITTEGAEIVNLG